MPKTMISQYRYDALDQLVNCTQAEQPPIQRFYQMSHLTTEIQGDSQRSIVQQDDQLLAVHERVEGTTNCALLATDQQRSVLRAYTAYGHSPAQSGLLGLLGFNGERPDPITGHYLLGSYRTFNPVLMRFHCPDSLSPFDEGGLNAYAYCEANPINRADATGHRFIWVFIKSIVKWKNIARARKPPLPPRGVTHAPVRPPKPKLAPPPPLPPRKGAVPPALPPKKAALPTKPMSEFKPFTPSFRIKPSDSPDHFYLEYTDKRAPAATPVASMKQQPPLPPLPTRTSKQVTGIRKGNENLAYESD